VISYLRGPLTRAQIKELMAARRESIPAAPPPVAATSAKMADASPRPVLPSEIAEYFVPARGAAPDGCTLLYQPELLGAAQVRFVDAKRGVDSTRVLILLTPIENAAVAVNWENSSEAELELDELERAPEEGALFGSLPAAASKAKSYAPWSRDLVNWLYGSHALELLRSPSLGEISRVDESERDFRIRLQQAAREKRDASVDKLRKSYAPRISALGKRFAAPGKW
jgi:hypothetical protein